MKKMFYVLTAVVFLFVACGEDPTTIKPQQNDNDSVEDEDAVDDEDVFQDNDTAEAQDADADADEADTENLDKICQTDKECGTGNICVNQKCQKGCTSDSECPTDLQCNQALGRCLLIYVSERVCHPNNCPAGGCCYADKGLTGLKCERENPSINVCGVCPQGQIYDGSNCIDALCSTTTDNCPSLNSSSTNPPSKCFKCESDHICKANTTSSGCSAGVVINAAKCVPAGQQCVEGVSECCSGMPCVQGYCY